MAVSTPLRSPAECVVRVDGQELLELYPYLSEVSVEMSREAATVCSLVFDSLRTEKGEWIVQDDPRLQPWKRILIEARFGSYTEEVMRGYIKEIKAEYPEDMSAARVTVLGQDESLLLDREHVRQTWSQPLSDDQLVAQIAVQYNLTAQASPGLSNASLSCDSTLIKLLRDRAEANGFELFVRAGTVYFQPPPLAGAPQATIMVYAGLSTNCLSFSANYDGHKPDQVKLTRQAEQSTQVESKLFTPNLQQLGPVPATSTQAGLAPFVWCMEQPNGANAAEAEARAQAKANENAWKVIAEGELDGALYGHVLLTHKTVMVDGAGTTYGGLYYVSSVEHRFSTAGYRQRFKLLRNATGETLQSGPTDVLAGLRAG